MQERKKTNKQTKNLVCSCPKVENLLGEENASTWFLKSPKAHRRIQPSWLMPRQKGILLLVRDNQLLLIILRWSLNGSIAILWRRMKNDAILFMKAFVPLHQGGEKSDSFHLMVQETWGKICDIRRQRNKGENTLFQLLAELAVPAASSIMPEHPLLHPSSYHLASVPRHWGPGSFGPARPPYMNQLESPVLVPRTEGPDLVPPRQGNQSGPGATTVCVC